MQSAFFPQQQQGQHSTGAVPSQPASGSNINKKASITHTGSPLRHAAPGSISQAAAGSRALRFPSSRRYLWDKTAAGPQVLIDALDYLPHVQVAASTFGAISKAASNKASSLPLQLSLSVSSTNQISALIQEHDPLSTQGALQLTCTLTQPGASAADAASSLRAAVRAHIDQRDIARVQQLYALSASATPAASPADPTSLKLQLLMPRAGLLATPLYTKRLCHVPLAEALLKPGCMATGQTGYLSMDQARSLLPLEATDANVYSTPLVGVWVKGPASVLHPLVTAACLRFAFSSLLMDRSVSTDDGAFLLLLCPEGDPVSKCFEVQVTDSSKLDLACYRLEAGVRPAAGLSQYPGGLVSATWLPDQSQVQPLPGSLTAGGAGSLLQAGTGTGSYSKAPSAAGTPSRATLGYSRYMPDRGLHEPTPAGADSPVLYSHGGVSRAPGELPLGRSSAPSAAYSTAAQLQQGAAAAAAAAARRSLPLTYYGENYGRGGPAAAAPGSGQFGADEPQPRLGAPSAPYLSSAQPHVQSYSQPWQQQQQYEADAALHGTTVAASGAPADAGGDLAFCSTCSSPTKGTRQQQLTWSDRQDQVLRRSLEGAAEALRSSQASLAAAREAASGAGSRLSSPTKARSAVGEGAFAGAAAGGMPEGAAAAATAVAAGSETSTGQAQAASPQPCLSRLGQQQQQQQQGDAEADSGPRMDSPLRMSAHKKASMLAAAAAHAAGIATSTPAGASAGAGTGPMGGGQQAEGEERPVSPAVQAGVALSNLSLLQHLSAGQLQQHGPGFEAVGHAAVAAAAGSPVAAGRSYAAAVAGERQQQGQTGQQQYEPPAQHPAGADTNAAPAYNAALGAANMGSAVTDSYNASHAAAAAIQAASSSMQRMPVHPYDAQSLGVQRYAADVAVMRSSQGSLGGMGLLSPGSSPGMYHNNTAARWQPLHQQQQQQQAGQQHEIGAGLASGWPPGVGAATPGVVGHTGASRGSPYWQQQQYGGQQQQQQQLVSPVSAGLSPGWVPDPVAQALQGEVDRLRQQLQQLQQQLKMAGMGVPTPDLEGAAAASPAQLAAAAVAAPAEPAPVAALPAAVAPVAAPPEVPAAALSAPQSAPAAAAPAAVAATHGSPMPVRDGGVHINVFLSPGASSPQVHMLEQRAAAFRASHAETPWQHPDAVRPMLPFAQQQLLQQQQQVAVPAQRYPAVSYAGAAAEAPKASAAAGAAPSAYKQSPAAAGGGAAAAAAAESAPQQAGQGASAADASAHAAPAAVAEAEPGATAESGGKAPAEAQLQQPGAQDASAESAAQQAATASAARQRRRKLDFEAAAAAAAAADAAAQASAASFSVNSEGSANSSDAGEQTVSDVTNANAVNTSLADVPAAKAVDAAERMAVPATVAAAEEGSSAAVSHPVACSSPAITHKGTAPAAKASPQHPAYAGLVVPSALPAAAAGALRSSAASSTAGMCYIVSRSSVPRSSGGGLGQLRSSLDAPPLVEVVRTRVVELSDDSDSDEWEDRLLVKYGLK